jgi:hypothetical protein
MATLSVAITSAIFGASRLEQLIDTLAAANDKPDSAVRATLEDVSSEHRRGDAESERSFAASLARAQFSFAPANPFQRLFIVDQITSDTMDGANSNTGKRFLGISGSQEAHLAKKEE